MEKKTAGVYFRISFFKETRYNNSHWQAATGTLLAKTIAGKLLNFCFYSKKGGILCKR
jgi:hypothetical protein